MKIALIVNTRTGDTEEEVEFDPPHTIEMMRKGILEAGFEYVFIEGNETVWDELQKHKPDLVFNRTEGLNGESREAHIPAILEMLQIPYVGSGVKTLAVCLDKAWTKTFVQAHGVHTPEYKIVSNIEGARAFFPRFPVILKPNEEGSSIGINEDNVVWTQEAFERKIEQMLSSYQQNILVESFIAGREISIGVLVRSPYDIEIFPPLEVDFSKMPSKVGGVFGQIAKTTYDDLSHYLCPAPISSELKNTLEEQSRKICQALEIREFARLDFRIDDNGQPWFLEINPLPGMDFDMENNDFSFYSLMAFKAGYSFDTLMAKLIDSTCKRVSFAKGH